MKTYLACFLGFFLMHFYARGQRNCGQVIMYQALEAKNPGAISKIREFREKRSNNIQGNPAAQSQNLKIGQTLKTTASPLIPIVFHFVIDSNAYKNLGGIAGIESRIESQMKVLNDDFNGLNLDKSKVPSVWTSVIGNVGLEFALAKITPSGSPTPGYTIKIAPNGTGFDVSDGGIDMKFDASGGTDQWDNTKYLNVWIGNIKFGGSNALGVTVPPGTPFYTIPEYGIALNQYAFGVRTSWTQPFIANIDRGRTLTHEMGHFFQLTHTWGDDGGLCFGSGGLDDGMNDTPNEADAIFGDPKFPLFDACTPIGNGIMFMNFMDYTNDSSMYMFTKEQALRIKSEISVGGNSYSLTLNRYLGDTQIKAPIEVSIYPNPSTGVVILQYDFIKHPLQKVVVYNLLGQKLIDIDNQNINTIDLSILGKGLYFIHCYFDNQIIKQKITLQ